jgi:hypothetical protein
MNRGGPTLQLIDSVTLAETDSAYVGLPTGLFVDTDGSILVSDGFGTRVLNFAGDGRLLRVYGTKGRGPGEFLSPGVVAANDREVFVDDNSSGLVTVLDRRTGVFVRSVKRQGLAIAGELSRDTLWLGLFSASLRTGVARWPSAKNSVERMVTLPGEYIASERLVSIYPFATMTHWGDTIMAAFVGSPKLLLDTESAGRIDSLILPQKLRRGIPADLEDTLAKMNDPDDYVRLVSYVRYIHRLPGGEVAVVHYDNTYHGNLLKSDVYVSLLNARRTSACVDTKLSVSSDTSPFLFFRDSTLFLIEQAVDSTSRPTTYVKRIRVNSAGCDWIPVLRPQ